MVSYDNTLMATVLSDSLISSSAVDTESRWVSEQFRQLVHRDTGLGSAPVQQRLLVSQVESGKTSPNDLSPDEYEMYDELTPEKQQVYLLFDADERFEYWYTADFSGKLMLEQLRGPRVEQRTEELLARLATVQGGVYKALAETEIPNRKIAFKVLPSAVYQQLQNTEMQALQSQIGFSSQAGDIIYFNESHFFSPEAFDALLAESPTLLRYSQGKHPSIARLMNTGSPNSPLRYIASRQLETPQVKQRIEQILHRFESPASSTETSREVAGIIRDEKVKLLILKDQDFNQVVQLTTPPHKRPYMHGIEALNSRYLIYMPESMLQNSNWAEQVLLHEGSEVLRRVEGMDPSDVAERDWEGKSYYDQNEYAEKNGLPIRPVAMQPPVEYFTPDPEQSDVMAFYWRLDLEQRAVYRNLPEDVQTFYNNAYRSSFESGGLLRHLILQGDWSPQMAQRTDALLTQLSAADKSTEVSQQIAQAVRNGDMHVIVLPDKEFQQGLQTAQPDLKPHALRPTTAFAVANTVFVQQSSYMSDQGLNQGVVDLMLNGHHALQHNNLQGEAPLNRQEGAWQALLSFIIVHDDSELSAQFADIESQTGEYLGQFGSVANSVNGSTGISLSTNPKVNPSEANGPTNHIQSPQWNPPEGSSGSQAATGSFPGRTNSHP